MSILDTPTRHFIERDSGAGLPYMPALDGLRGLAVAGVVAFHSGHEVMVGGFLGVSTFFTLSGFLITSLLLGEAERTGGVDLRRFWSRRFRRLLPASSATLVLAVVFGLTVATAGQRLGLRADVLASLFQVANWRFVLAGTSYGDLFSAPSPVLHFWSLAIEEQFYLLFPLLLLGVVRLARGRRGVILVVLVVLTGASWVLPMLVELSQDRIYFGTDTRAAELLLGALLAVVLSRREVRRRMALRYHARSVVLTLGGACLAVQLYWWVTLEQSSEWLYRGGLGLYGAMSALVIAAAAVPSGPFHMLLSNPVLRWLGERSYGIYLVHWPVFLALRQKAPDLDGVVRTGIGVVVVLVVAELSYRLLERPVRAGRWPVRGKGHRVALPAVAVVALVALVPMPVDEDEEPIDFGGALEQFEARRPAADTTSTTTTTTTAAPRAGATTSTSTTTIPPAPVPRIATFGDSTALLMGLGLDQYRQEAGLPAGILGSVELGCGVSRFDAIRLAQVTPVTDLCRSWPDRWRTALARDVPDVAQLVTGVWEVADARLPGASEFSAIGDPAVDAFVRSELLEAVDTLSSTGALVLVVLWPPDVQDGTVETAGRPRIDPARMFRFHELQRSVAAERPDTTRIVDLSSWFGDRAQDPQWRPDGVHIQQDRAAEVYREWMAAEIDRIWEDWWRESVRGGG